MKRFSLIFILIVPFLFSSFAKNKTEKSNEKEFVVVLDAGHGGHDPGNLGNGYLEKNIALNIVLRVGAMLEKKSNIKVVYTRNTDVFVDLFDRGEIANKANADLFVSIHCDSHSSDAHGAGTFVLGLHANKQNFEIAKKENSVIYLEDNYETRYSDYDINSPESVIGLTIMQEEFLDQSIALAKTIQDNFSNKLKRKDRKVKQAGFIVLHQTFMPSVLVETGFLTNVDEGAYLNSWKGQSEIGKAIADAVLVYKKSVDVNTLDTSSQVNKSLPDPKKEKVTATDDKTIAAVVAKNKPNQVNEETNKTIEEAVVASDKKVKKSAVNTSKVAENKKLKPVSNIVFKVQLMARTKKVPLTPKQFNGLNELSEESYKKFTRYMYGKVHTYEEAKLLKTNADKKGYTTSYIVAYKDGERISVPQAIKYISEY